MRSKGGHHAKEQRCVWESHLHWSKFHLYFFYIWQVGKERPMNESESSDQHRGHAHEWKKISPQISGGISLYCIWATVALFCRPQGHLFSSAALTHLGLSFRLVHFTEESENSTIFLLASWRQAVWTSEEDGEKIKAHQTHISGLMPTSLLLSKETTCTGLLQLPS